MEASSSSALIVLGGGAFVASYGQRVSSLWPSSGNGRRAPVSRIACRSSKVGATSREHLTVKLGIVALLAGSRNNRTVGSCGQFAFTQFSKRLQPSLWSFTSLSSSSSSSWSRRVCCNAELGGSQSSGQQSSSSDSGAGSERSAGVTSKNGLNSEPQDPKLNSNSKTRNFWSNLKEQHVIYGQDRDRWGLGFNPIFVVHEDANGRPYQVDVNEEEILARSGVGDGITQFTDDESRDLAKTRVEMARAHARDIELGLVIPSPLSVVYKFERAKISTASGATPQVFPWESADGGTVAVAQFLSFLIVVGSVALAFAIAKRVFTKKEVIKDPVHEKNVQAIQMRKLRAQRIREDSDGVETDRNFTPKVNGMFTKTLSEKRKDAPEVEVLEQPNNDVQPPMNDELFKKKVTQIRALARKARLQEQENAEARSKSDRTSLELDLAEEGRDKGNEGSAESLDDDRRLGSETLGIADASVVDGGKEGNEPVREGEENPRSGAKARSNSSTVGVKPRVILSAEEARARIAAKRARQNGTASISGNSSKPAMGKSSMGSDLSKEDSENAGPLPPTSEAVNPADAIERGDLGSSRSDASQELSPSSSDKTLENSDGENARTENSSGKELGNENLREVDYESASLADGDDLYSKSNGVTSEIGNDGKTKNRAHKVGRTENGVKSKDEEEEMEWMRDDVLREIVFKVHANEEAGREPFHNLNSEQETLFFKGLERKFEREGEEVKTWIKDRVENIDYGADGISIFDPPESYELKWKKGVDGPSKSNFYDKFKEDRERIINEKRGESSTSSFGVENASASGSEDEARSSSLPSLPTPADTLPVHSDSPNATTMDEDNNRRQDGDAGVKTKSVISSSPRAGRKAIVSPPSDTVREDGESKGTGANWDHTKKWAKELERKYAMETDPKIRALMLEMGQDLDRWITPDEIDAASEMLERGSEGEEEYVKMHYERMKAKIQKQREMFGRDAMLSKYSEYTEEEEIELWWLGLPYVVCIGLRATVEEELQTGLYSIDVGGALEGVPGLPTEAYHTVAFQDRGDAQNFCTFVNSQPEKLSADGAEPVPFHPKELYQDAKSEGFKVTVIKKGQLQFSVDTPFEEVEHRIVELGSATYVKDVMNDRVIDMDAVVREGLGFGRQP